MKMDVDEFRKRLSEVTAQEQPIVVMADEKVIGHYMPVTNGNPEALDIERWATSRLEARARWIARTPAWQERLMRFGLDEEGDPYENEPRR